MGFLKEIVLGKRQKSNSKRILTKGRIFKKIREKNGEEEERRWLNRFLWSFLLFLLFVFTILIFLKIDLELLLHSSEISFYPLSFAITCEKRFPSKSIFSFHLLSFSLSCLGCRMCYRYLNYLQPTLKLSLPPSHKEQFSLFFPLFNVCLFIRRGEDTEKKYSPRFVYCLLCQCLTGEYFKEAVDESSSLRTHRRKAKKVSSNDLIVLLLFLPLLHPREEFKQNVSFAARHLKISIRQKSSFSLKFFSLLCFAIPFVFRVGRVHLKQISKEEERKRFDQFRNREKGI